MGVGALEVQPKRRLTSRSVNTCHVDLRDMADAGIEAERRKIAESKVLRLRHPVSTAGRLHCTKKAYDLPSQLRRRGISHAKSTTE